MNSLRIRSIASLEGHRRFLRCFSHNKQLRRIHTNLKAPNSTSFHLFPVAVTGIFASVSLVSAVNSLTSSCEAKDSGDVEVAITGGTGNEEIKDGNNGTGQGTNKKAEATIESSSQEDRYDNLPEEDEPTHCTICLINRQGPCRRHWRKFERCMKDHSPKGEENESESDNSKEKSSLAEACDTYMLPWIQCIQGYKHTYTLISNNFFQEEFVDGVENSVEESDKVDLDVKGKIASIIEIDQSWWDEKKERDDNGICLVEGIARINLVDEGNGNLIDIAYIRDQDGKMLGYNEFSPLKKELKEGKAEGDKPSVGTFTFHVNPDTTKGIRVFALYKNQEDVGSIESKDSSEVENSEGGNASRVGLKQTLYQSAIFSMEDFIRSTATADVEQKIENSSKA